MVINEDTLICNSLEEQAFLIKQYFKVHELLESERINIAIISALDSNLIDCQKSIVDQSEQLEIAMAKDRLKDDYISSLKNEIITQNKAVRKQKFYKWTAIIIGSATTAIMTRMYLKK